MVNQINSIMQNLELLNQKSSKVTYGLSTGNAIQNGSDDSSLYNSILSIKNSLSTYDSIQTNIESVSSYNSLSDSNIASIKTAMETINTQILTASTDTTADSEREIISTQIEALKQTILDLVNDTSNGQYLFSGVDTSTQPFSVDETTGTISYVGSMTNKTVNVEQGKYQEIGVTGFELMYYTSGTASLGEDLIFSENDIITDKDGNQWQMVDTNNDGAYDGLYLNGDASATSLSVINNTDGTYTITNTTTATISANHGYFDDLDELIAALKQTDTNGNAITSDEASTLITNALTTFDSAYDNINAAHALVGTRTNTVDNYNELITSKITHFTLLQEEFASADLTALAVESQALENTYTALYSTINKINSMSLVNFLS